MDVIEQAKEMMETAAEVESIAAMQAFATMALAQAAIAQAAALTRIADALEHINGGGQSFTVAESLYGLMKQNQRE